MQTRPVPSDLSPGTTVTQLTPSGRGAVATLVVEGPDALPAVSAFFRPHANKSLDATSIDRIRFGCWHHHNGDQEEIVVCRRRHGIEVHCHGGDAAVAAITAGLVSRGLVVGDGMDWLNQRFNDPLEQAVRCRLAAARTQRTAGILLDQIRGAWPAALEQVAAAIKSGRVDLARQRLQRLAELAPLGERLTGGWQIVVVGQPNVGKSSLVNTMLGFSRCIVFDQPGTTRDIVATHSALDGWPVELMDTAGLREGQNAIEIEGVARALSRAEAADLVVHVWDAARPESQATLSAVDQHPNVLTVENKSDLITPISPNNNTNTAIGRQPADVQTSAVTKDGVDQLIELIVRRLVPNPPEPGEAVPLIDAQHELLKAVQASIASNDIATASALLAGNRS